MTVLLPIGAVVAESAAVVAVVGTVVADLRAVVDYEGSATTIIQANQ